MGALRTMFGKTYPQGSVSVVDDEKNLNRQLDALQRLVDNTHLEQNPRTSNSTFTGLEQEVLHRITTTEMMATTSQVAEEAGKQGSGTNCETHLSENNTGPLQFIFPQI